MKNFEKMKKKRELYLHIYSYLLNGKWSIRGCSTSVFSLPPFPFPLLKPGAKTAAGLPNKFWFSYQLINFSFSIEATLKHLKLYARVLPKRSHLNGNTTGFRPQMHELE